MVHEKVETVFGMKYTLISMITNLTEKATMRSEAAVYLINWIAWNYVYDSIMGLSLDWLNKASK